jgi:hypothetical protein
MLFAFLAEISAWHPGRPSPGATVVTVADVVALPAAFRGMRRLMPGPVEVRSVGTA